MIGEVQNLVLAITVGDLNLQKTAFQVLEHFLPIRELIFVEILFVADSEVAFGCLLPHLFENGQNVKHTADAVIKLLVFVLFQIFIEVLHIFNPDTLQHVVQNVGEEPCIQFRIQRVEGFLGVTFEVTQNNGDTLRVELL